jgi:hypothetical protein
MNHGKLCSAYNAEKKISWIVRSTLGAFKGNAKVYSIFPTEFRLSRLFQPAMNTFHPGSSQYHFTRMVTERDK